MLYRHKAFGVLAICLVAAISLLFSGCGSVSIGDYETKVNELNETASGALNEISEVLAEEAFDEEGQRIEAVTAALEEIIDILEKVVEELGAVKVPDGMEDFQRELLAFHHANLLAYEELMATLEPGDPEEEGGEEETSVSPVEGQETENESGGETHESAEETPMPSGEENPADSGTGH
jgi:hypothetical protein